MVRMCCAALVLGLLVVQSGCGCQPIKYSEKTEKVDVETVKEIEPVVTDDAQPATAEAEDEEADPTTKVIERPGAKVTIEEETKTRVVETKPVVR